MNKKIAIIGGGLFGVTCYLKLKQKNLDCTLFEKKNDLLLGASTNNLNRVHFGYHYPRDDKTATQSYKGYLSFKKFFKKSIISNFKNYYAIAKKSKINFADYIKFCKRNSLKFQLIKKQRLKFNINNIEGCIKVKEPIYDWELIKNEVDKKISNIKNNKIKKKEFVKKISKKNKFIIETNKNKYSFDLVIDASYDQSNSLIKNFKNNIKKKYQLVVVFEFNAKNFKNMGLAVMDGNFFSFLPKGKKNKHLFYHVKYSILKEKVCKSFPNSWLDTKRFNPQIKKLSKLAVKDFKKFLPDLKIEVINKTHINPRVLLPNVEKTDRRISQINEITKNYFQIFSAKVDHSVDIADQILKKIKKRY